MFLEFYHVVLFWHLEHLASVRYHPARRKGRDEIHPPEWCQNLTSFAWGVILLRFVGYIRFCFSAVFYSLCLSWRRVSCTWVVRWVWAHLTTYVYHFNIFSDCAVFCIVYNNLICNRLKIQNIVIFLWWWLILLICI